MATHRRPVRGSVPSRRQSAARGRRRLDSSPLPRYLVFTLGLCVSALGAFAGPAIVRDASPSGESGHERITLAGLPDNLPEQGLVYDGLATARPDTPCAGGYEVASAQSCTSGPDLPPEGLTVGRDVAPVAASADEPQPPQRETADAPKDAEVVTDAGGAAATDDGPAFVPDAAPGATEFVLGGHGVACVGDGDDGKRVQVVYLHEVGTPSRYAAYLGSLRTWTAQVDQIFDASAARTGGSRHLRLVTTPDCRVDVAEVQLPDGALTTFADTVKALHRLGYNRTDRKYLLFADTHRYCGIATFLNDNRAGARNRNNGGPSYARVDAGCWGPVTATHELAHTLGAVLPGTPHASGSGHCTDGYDLLCQGDETSPTVRTVCADPASQQLLDCNNDDYFHTDPRPGSYLDTHWNVADSAFLLDGADASNAASDPTAPPAGSDGDDPAAQPRPGSDDAESSADQQPTAEARPPGANRTPAAGSAETRPAVEDAPGADPAPGTDPVPGTDAGQPDAGRVGTDQRRGTDQEPGPDGADQDGADPDGADPDAAEPDSPQAPANGAPDGSRDPATGAGEPPGAVDGPREGPEAVLEVRDPASTSVRLSWPAAAPGTRYAVAVDGTVVATTTATRGRLIGLTPDTGYSVRILLASQPTQTHTAPARAQTVPGARPADNAWFVLVNSLTGASADLYAARSANGVPLVLNRVEGGAQQQWRLVPAGLNEYQVQSRVSGKCVAPMGGDPAPGVPLVQVDCSDTDGDQRWRIDGTKPGFTMRTTVGDLVVGAGNQRFGGPRVLVLQESDGSRHQSWTALPG